MFPTVQFGTRLAVNSLLDHDDDDGYKDPPVYTDETCPNHKLRCDAVKDCTLGSDETNCGEKKQNKKTTLPTGAASLTEPSAAPFSPVRFGRNNSLQVMTAEDGRFLPVCYSGWDQSLAQDTCAMLGFRG